MATKTPSAKIPKTSGQGISRRSYMQGYALKDTGAPKIKAAAKVETKDDGHRYAKNKPKKYEAKGFNVSYGDTIEPGDLEDVVELGAQKRGR